MDPSGEAAQKTQQLLTYYELDLGLNHVVRKYSEQLEEHANFLISGNAEQSVRGDAISGCRLIRLLGFDFCPGNGLSQHGDRY